MAIGNEDWLTPQQVAELFGVSTWTVRRWEDRGALIPERLPSGHRRYRKSDVDRLLAQRRGGSTDQSES